MRKLVTLRTITEITPIENADAIEAVHVDGWKVVAQKGIHSVGNQVLYFELDSFLPASDSRFDSFMKFGTRVFNDVVGHRLKTKKLRGVYSQGIIMPLSDFPEVTGQEEDIATLIGVVKYDPPEVFIGSVAKGSFPSFLRKSDQERIQNIWNKIPNELFVPTLKMDGSSVTVFAVDEKYGDVTEGICSRNQLLRTDQESSFLAGVTRSRLLEKVRQIRAETGMSIALQGELVGPGVQGNYEQFDHHEVFVYNVFNVDAGEFLDYTDFTNVCNSYEIKTVPQVGDADYVTDFELDEILKFSDGRSINAKVREGIVWKGLYSNFQFKVISNKFLEKSN